ncbi:MAG: hypothetical protein Q8927_17695 [Bacteroidota bacterium]|nr:hypothetical protein [Bacteroidota bacterium]MDP4245241.1 hypothetical protein [Bacteroidota bacterium]MDP4255855.1 hypothetical protein [Bacteroidota bacterium]MDP4260303.1 hypothetical protein [Bacteroidota bacterium]
MKIIRVTYTTRPAFVEQNKANIQKVMNDLRQLNEPGLFYFSCLGPDGKTFIHTAFFKTDADNERLLKLPSFLRFQQELKAAGFEVPPKQELLTLVGSSDEARFPQ